MADASEAAAAGDDDDVPPDFACPITQELMEDPVTCKDGMTYERSEIEEWFRRGNRTSPKTNATLPTLEVVPNHSLRGAIATWRERRPRAAARLESLRRANRLLAARPVEAPRSIPARFFDPFLPSLMVDPVRAEDGHDYNRACLQKWVADAARTRRPLVSPITRAPMGPSFTSNAELRAEIAMFVAARFPRDQLRMAPSTGGVPVDEPRHSCQEARGGGATGVGPSAQQQQQQQQQQQPIESVGSVQDLNEIFAVLDVRAVGRSIPPQMGVDSISCGSPHVRCTPCGPQYVW